MYAEIATVLEACPNPTLGLRFACELAADLAAKLVGLYIQTPELLPIGLIVGPESSLVAASQAVVRRAMYEVETKNIFETLAIDAGIEWEWRQLSDASNSRIARHMRHSDLILIASRDFSGSGGTSAANVPGLIIECGRPALFIPSALPHLPFRNILIGWNSSREATRAGHDALPFLRRAERVVVAIAADGSFFEEEYEPALDIGKHLARHGVRVEVERLAAPGQDAGTVLLALAASMSADLIVVGCYGHMRLTEFIFGGVPRTLLRDARIPLMLSY